MPIRTIYLEDNSSSHFRPVIDSVRIYAPLLTFLATSLSAFVLDATLVIGLYALFGSLLPAVVLARLVSGTVNFTLNRRLVFRRGSHSTARRTAAAGCKLPPETIEKIFGDGSKFTIS